MHKKIKAAKDKSRQERRVAFEITPFSGQAYKELSRRMRFFDIPDFTILADWLDSLFDEDGILKESVVTMTDIDQLIEMQVRDEKVDTAYAKSLNFTLDYLLDENGEPLPDQNVVALNTPGISYNQSGNQYLPIGLHRFWKAKSLGASRYPVICVPEHILAKVSIISLHAMCRLDNSVIHQAKTSTLAQDAASVCEVFRQRLIDNPLEENADSFEQITADKATCRDKYPQYWELLRNIASSASVAHGAIQIRNHIFKETLRSGFKSFLNGKIDQVRTSLKKTHSPVLKDGEESGNKFYSNEDDKHQFEITLCEGGNQQEQNTLARISRKRVTENIPIIGIICGTGPSASALLKSRISFLELFLPLAVNYNFDVVEKLLRANYRDGFWKYPQFIQGLEKQEIDIGGKKYQVSCPAESEVVDWEVVSIDSVVSFLRRYHFANPKSLVFNGYEEEIGKLVLPNNSVVVEVAADKKLKKVA